MSSIAARIRIGSSSKLNSKPSTKSALPVARAKCDRLLCEPRRLRLRISATTSAEQTTPKAITHLPSTAAIDKLAFVRLGTTSAVTSRKRRNTDRRESIGKGTERCHSLHNRHFRRHQDASASTLRRKKGKDTQEMMQIVDGQFKDARWIDGRWDLTAFKGASGDTDWDDVIDAEIARRQLLEDTPIASINDAVKFDTSEIPWWAWVKRFHLPVVRHLRQEEGFCGMMMI